jgi:hypothetical protein
MLATFAYIPEGLTAIPAIQRGVDEQNGIIRGIGREHNVPVLDFAAEMPKNRQLWADGVHVNERGANIKAKIFSKFIVRHGLVAAEEQDVT